MIVPILALAGSMAAKRRVPPSLGTFPTTGPLFGGPARRRDRHRRRADLLPGAVAGPDRRAAAPERRQDLLRPWSSSVGRSRTRHPPLPALRHPRAVPSPPASRRDRAACFDPDLLRAALPQSFRKLDPRLLIKNPVMFVVEVTAALVTLIAVANVTGIQPRAGPAGWASRSRSRLALVHGALRDLRRGRGRGSRPGTGSHPAPDTVGDPRTAAAADGTIEDVGSSELRRGDVVVVARGRDDPRRRRRHRGRGLRQRGGHHRRVGPGAQGARHRHPLVVTGGTRSSATRW